MRKSQWFVALCLLCVLCVSLPTAQAATRQTLMAQGTVVAGSTTTILAPFGGVLSDSSLKAGDLVSAGDVLHDIQTTAVYAPFDGTVGGVRAQPGDDVTAIQNKYTALLYIEPTSPYSISTTTKNAYAATENYLVHVGETVYLRSNTTRKRTGVGFVTLVDGSSFEIEVTDGNLELEEYVDIYRDPDHTYVSKIGTGQTERNGNVAITVESGSIYAVHVAQGDVVKRGDLLLEVVTGSVSQTELPSNVITAPEDAIVASLDASAGESVAQNQVLSTLYPLGNLQVEVQVSESDLQQLEVGDTVRLEFEYLSNQENLTGTIASISGLSVESADEDSSDASYSVYIDFNPGSLVRQGMNVNVFFNVAEDSDDVQESAEGQQEVPQEDVQEETEAVDE